MTVKYSREFNKQFAKLKPSQQQQVTDTLELFLDNPTHESLRNHPLAEEWAGWRSISAGGDLRLHFRMLDDDTVFFVAAGTHSQLYK
jgi:addiction module RelE/StbE family toxin